MPMIKLQVAGGLAEDKREQMLASISRIVSEGIGKPEKYVMVSIEEGALMMSGEEGAAAFADLRSIGGLNQGVNREISRKLCALLEETLKIPPDRVYISFTEVSADNWGWDGSTFG